MKEYKGPGTIKQLAYLRENYKGKNMSGGRKTYFRQSKDYRNGYTPTASSWFTGARRGTHKFYIPAPNPQ